MQKQLKRITSLLLVFMMAASVILELPEGLGWGGRAYAASTDFINTVAGNGTAGFSGDTGAATSAKLNFPYGVAVDSSGNLYIADQQNHRIRKVAADGTISTVAGTGTAGYSGDGAAAILAQLSYPRGVTVDSSGNLYIADTQNNRIRKVAAADGMISTVAGTGAWGYSGDGGAATSAQLDSPNGVAVDSSGNLYIADTYNYRIRKIATDGTISTVAGTGTAGYSGDLGQATSAMLDSPMGVAVDSAGNLYIADSSNDRIRKVAAIDNTISTVAGTGTAGYSGDGETATSAMLNSPYGVTVDSTGDLYIADYMNSRIRKVATDGTISTVAGTGLAGYSGDGIAATSAQLQYATGVALDSGGNLYIAEFFGHRIRQVGKAYIVIFNSNGGSAVSSQPVNYNGAGTATLPADPTRTGYNFGGWYADSGLTTSFNFATVIMGDTSLYAKWTAVPVSVTGVTLDQSTLALTAGGTVGTLAETVSPSNATDKSVTWSSSNMSVATVSSSGVVTPVAAGTATITVTTTDGSYTATSAVTVSAAIVPVTGVALDQSTLALTAGGTVGTLAETVSPSNATDKSVTWSSSNTSVATVSSSGVVTPVAAGTATITVTTTDGSNTATSAVTVSAATVPVTGVALDQSTLALTAGGTVGSLAETVSPSNATDKSVTWSSSNTSVATVSNSGVVMPVAAGTATITVTTTDGSYTATSAVTVSAATVPVTGVALDQSTLALSAGGTVGTLAGTVSPSNATDKSVTWSSSNMSVATVSSSGVVTPVAAGTATITVTTTDGSYTATSAVTVSAATVPAAPPTPDTSNTPTTGAEVLVNGKAESAGTATTTKVNEQTVTTVTVNSKKLEDKLAAEGQYAVITIPVNTNSDVVIGELDGQMVKNMEQKQATVEIKTENATYTLPAQQINIDSISDQLGKSVQLQDIKLQIEISKPNTDTVKIVENSASKGEFALVVPPLNFTVKANYGDTTIEVSKFNIYVERTIAIPEGVDPSKITTGVVVNPDGTVRHVPTKIVIIDGKYYAKVNSLTNSTYSIVWHPQAFKDVAQHWAKDAVNDMGSRMVISGIGNDLFNPDQDITRAEFAAIMVRGLGLKLEIGSSPFADVKATDWYSSAIQTAYVYKLISGFEDGTFRPMDKITREQAMTIIAEAMTITDLKAKLPSKAADKLLSPFADANNASEWAKNSIIDCLQAGIVSGRNSTELAPKAYITRAEVAAIVQRLLQKSELI